jgi:hypothetical protein
MDFGERFSIERIGRITPLEMAALIKRVPIVRPPVCCHECQDPVLAGRIVGGRFLCEPCSVFDSSVTRPGRIRR